MAEEIGGKEHRAIERMAEEIGKKERPLVKDGSSLEGEEGDKVAPRAIVRSSSSVSTGTQVQQQASGQQFC